MHTPRILLAFILTITAWALWAQSADTTPPSVPTGLTLTSASDTAIELTWTISTDDVGVTGYNIYRNGTNIGTSTGPAFFDTALTASTSYTYRVEAFDAETNTSAACAAISATTLPPNTRASVINPTPMIISQPVPKAYPGIDYNIRLGVIGGHSRYTFALDAAPSGMAISSNGTVTWTPAVALNGQSFPVTYRVIDSKGQVVTQSFTLSVTTDGFHFVSTAGNDTTGNGTLQSPWATINKGLSSGATGDTIYVRAGTYVQKWTFVAGKANRIVAFPGEKPIADFNFEKGPGIKDSGTTVDGFEIKNIVFKAFQVGSGQDNLVFRRNHMHDLYDDSEKENPSFVYFWDIGTSRYSNIIIQESTFHDLFDRGSGLHGDTTANYHASSTTWYNVELSLYEDNEVYNIDGGGMNDKDDGYKNTFRGNYFHDNHGGGLGLLNQHTQDGAEVEYNIFDGKNLTVGLQPGYLRNVDIHHNTFHQANIAYGWVLADSRCYNFITRDNLFVNLTTYPYSVYPGSDGKILSASSTFDHNLIQTTSAYIFGYGWGQKKITFADWQTTYRKDLHSRLADPLLIDPANADFHLAFNSPARGAASDGSDIGAFPFSSNHAPVLTPIGNRSVPAGQQIQFTVQGMDEDGNPLNYSATGNR